MAANLQNIQYSNREYYFNQWVNGTEGERELEKAFEALPPDIKKYSSGNLNPDDIADSWWGGDGKKTFGELWATTEFNDKKLLKKAVDMYNELSEEIDMGGSFEKARLEITDNKNAVFQFGLASKGLYRPQEFYSEELEKDYPNEFAYMDLPSGIVPLEFIRENKLDNGEIIYYYRRFAAEDNEQFTDYIAEQQQLGTREGKKKFRSRTKRSYVKYKRQGGIRPYVDVIIPVGVNAGGNREGLLMRSLPTMILAKKLNEANIKTRLTIVIDSIWNEGGSMIVAQQYFTIKDYGQPFDFERVAYYVGEPAFFRAKNFKQTQGQISGGFLRTPDGRVKKFNRNVGRTGVINDPSLYRSTFLRYKNWLANASNNELNPLNTNADKKLMLSNIPDVVGNNISDPRAQESIKKEFYRMLDQAEFQFADTPKVAQRVVDRMQEEQGDNFSVLEAKRYLIKTLSTSYDYADNGWYSTPAEEQMQLEEEALKKINELEEYFDRIEERYN